MSTLLKFELGLDVVQFTVGSSYDVDSPLRKAQARERAADGSLQGETLGPSRNERNFFFEAMPKVDHDALKNFFDNVTNGMEKEFIVTDEYGFVGTAKFASPDFLLRETQFGFRGNVPIEYT